MGIIKDSRKAYLRQRIREGTLELLELAFTDRHKELKALAKRLKYMHKILDGLDKVKDVNSVTTVPKLLAQIDRCNMITKRMHELNRDYKKNWGVLEAIDCTKEELRWIKSALSDSGEEIAPKYKPFTDSHFKYLRQFKLYAKRKIEMIIPSDKGNREIYSDSTCEIYDNVDVNKITFNSKVTLDPVQLRLLREKGFIWSKLFHVYSRQRTINAIRDLEKIFAIKVGELID